MQTIALRSGIGADAAEPTSERACSFAPRRVVASFMMHGRNNGKKLLAVRDCEGLFCFSLFELITCKFSPLASKTGSMCMGQPSTYGHLGPGIGS